MATTVVDVAGANEAVDCISGETAAYVAFVVPEAGGLASGAFALVAIGALAARGSRRG